MIGSCPTRPVTSSRRPPMSAMVQIPLSQNGVDSQVYAQALTAAMRQQLEL